MERRSFLKALPATALLPAALSAQEANADDAKAQDTKASAGKAGTPPYSGGSQEDKKAPDFAKDMLTTDMQGLGPDGKATGQKDTFTGASKADATAEECRQEPDEADRGGAGHPGRLEGPEMAKLMKIQVVFGNTFGATKLADLGGAPHSNLYPGAPYLGSLIKMLDECAKAGLKSYAPYTVNPRPFDCFNVQNNVKEMQIVYEGYPLQHDLDWVHAQLRSAGSEQALLCLLCEGSGQRPRARNHTWPGRNPRR